MKTGNPALVYEIQVSNLISCDDRTLLFCSRGTHICTVVTKHYSEALVTLVSAKETWYRVFCGMKNMKNKYWAVSICSLQALFYLPIGVARAEPVLPSKPTQKVELEWIAPASQAENVVDMLDGEATLSIQRNDRADTRAFPVAVVIVGIFGVERVTSLLIDINRNSKPGAIIERDINGRVKVTQTPSLPRGCIIDNINKKPGCLFPDKQATDVDWKSLIGSVFAK